MATFILKQLWRNGQKGRFVSYPAHVLYIQFDYEIAYKEAKSLALYPGCLVIDDFGAERLTDFTRQVSYFIINTREQNDFQTIFTSNYSPEQINRLIDGRLSSRICGMCAVIHLEGKDKRINKNEQLALSN
jgi:DNA replication protein DnaC